MMSTATTDRTIAKNYNLKMVNRIFLEEDLATGDTDIKKINKEVMR